MIQPSRRALNYPGSAILAVCVMYSHVEALLITQHKITQYPESISLSLFNDKTHLTSCSSCRRVVSCVHLKFSVCSCGCGLFDLSVCFSVFVASWLKAPVQPERDDYLLRVYTPCV